MRRQRMTAVLFALLALALGAPAAAEAQQSSLAGTWTLNRGQSDDIQAAINRAVARMNFVTRPIARGRLRRTNTAYERVVIAFPSNQVSVRYDERNPIVSPASGAAVKWTREDGEVFDVSMRPAGGRLTQTFTAEDGSRENVYTLSADGRTLTMNVTIRSPRLSAPLTYKLVYNRAS